MTTNPLIFDRALLARRRDRAAAAATAHDFLLVRVAEDIADRLHAVKRTFPIAVDLGSHHGVVGRAVAQVPGVETVVSIEAAPALLRQAAAPKVQADEEALPFRDGALDLVVSGLSLHLVNDLPGTMIQVRRALKADGLFLGALLAGETLVELRQAFLAAEAEMDGGASPRVAPFADVRELGALLQRAGFALPVADSDTVTVTYADPLALVREIKAMGASNMLADRRRTPIRRATFVRALEIYKARFGLPNGRVPATFEIVTLTGWVPHESQQKPLRPGSAAARLADALGTTERSAGESAGNADPGRAG
ncbi:MAG: class I SAM-dependent methyltransferase [Hyphomicrobiaceae bacterium]